MATHTPHEATAGAETQRTLDNSPAINAARMAMRKGIVKPGNINGYLERLLRVELARFKAAFIRAGLPVPTVITKALAS